MLNNEFLNDLSNKIAAMTPMAQSLRNDVEKNIHEALQTAFSRLDLVTRDEFDAQLKVLERAEQTIAQLEEKIHAMEKILGQQPISSAENEKQ